MFSCLEGVKSLHVVEICDLPLLVPDDWERQIAAGYVVDILDPPSMALDCVRRQSNELHAALGEFWLEFREGAQLGRANGCVVLWVREQHHPVIANELMEVDGSVGGLGIEVGSNASKAERFDALFSHGDLFFKKSQTQANQANKWGAPHVSQAKVLEALEKLGYGKCLDRKDFLRIQRGRRGQRSKAFGVRHELNLYVCRLSAIACSPCSLAHNLYDPTPSLRTNDVLPRRNTSSITWRCRLRKK